MLRCKIKGERRVAAHGFELAPIDGKRSCDGIAAALQHDWFVKSSRKRDLGVVDRVIKKYSNRRLYDTERSRYITLDELTATIREGIDVRIVDAKTGTDLTQATLALLVIEGDAAKYMPVPLLTQLVRMGDDALAEFFSKYVTNALEMYLAARQGVSAVSPYFPFASLPLQAADAVMRMFGTVRPGAAPGVEPQPAGSSPAGEANRESPSSPATSSEVADLRRELAELRRELRGGRAGPEDEADDGSDDQGDAGGSR